MSETTLSSKGQLVIPLEVRRRLGLKAGDHFKCEIIDGKIVLEPQTSGSATLVIGDDGAPFLLAASGAPEMTPDMVREILSDHP